VLPATQDPLPVHPMPPHCENLGKLPPEAGAVVVAGFVAVDRVVGAGVVGATGLVVVGGGLPPTGATEVTGGVLTTPPPPTLLIPVEKAVGAAGIVWTRVCAPEYIAGPGMV